MSRAQALILAAVIAVVGFAAGRLFAGAADPDLPEPIVVEQPSTSAPGGTAPQPSSDADRGLARRTAARCTQPVGDDCKSGDGLGGRTAAAGPWAWKRRRSAAL